LADPVCVEGIQSPLPRRFLIGDVDEHTAAGKLKLPVGSGTFKSGNHAERADEAIVKSTMFTTFPTWSPRSPEAMVGINVKEIPLPHRLAKRGR
jgi:pyridoxal biosynthesis lyase PdxS